MARQLLNARHRARSDTALTESRAATGLAQMSGTARLRSGSAWWRAITAAAPTLVAAIAIVLLADTAAQADCTPASANDVTATCTGITINQGAGAPGTSADPNNGYGTAVETGVTVTVDINASVTGLQNGLALGSGAVTNSGSITGTDGLLGRGIYADTNATVTNLAAGSITGGAHGIFALGSADVTNSGSIAGAANAGIGAVGTATVTNNAGGSITGGFYGIGATVADVTNSGNITGGQVGIAGSSA